VCKSHTLIDFDTNCHQLPTNYFTNY